MLKIKLNTRLLWLDALKGFAILTVVYLHVHNGYEYEGTFDGEIIKMDHFLLHGIIFFNSWFLL